MGDAVTHADLLRDAGLRTSLPALPQSVHRVLGRLDAEGSGLEYAADAIAEDPVLTARVLRVANSPFFNPSAASTERVRDAVVRLGTDGTRNVVFTATVIKLFDPAQPPLDYKEFWRHSLVCAMATRGLGARARRWSAEEDGEPERLFLAGLLHDVGVLAWAAKLGRRYGQIVEQAEREERPLYQVEREALGFGHPEVAGALIRAWGLPEEIALVAELHHEPALAPEALRHGVQLLHVGDWISHQVTTGRDPQRADRMRESAWAELGLDADEIPEMIVDFERAAEQSDLFLALAG